MESSHVYVLLEPCPLAWCYINYSTEAGLFPVVAAAVVFNSTADICTTNSEAAVSGGLQDVWPDIGAPCVKYCVMASSRVSLAAKSAKPA